MPPSPTTSARRIGIAGAGVLGRLAAWSLARAGHAVTVFDPAPGPAPRHDGRGAAGFTAAGMLSPLAELDQAGPEIATLGWASLALWTQVDAALAGQPAAEAASREALRASLALGGGLARDAEGPPPARLRRDGSLLVAHGSDLGAAERVLARLRHAPAHPDPRVPRPEAQALDRAALRALEPAIDPQLRAWRLPGEGQVVPAAMLAALAATAPGVSWRWGARVDRCEPGRLTLTDGSAHAFDWVLDLRGLGARPAVSEVAPAAPPPSAPFTRDLRGVRGELVWLHAPGVALRRPVRLLHPRHRVYLVPRPGELVVVGASEVESEDRSPVSLRSAVELMAAAHSVIPALAEARIVHLETNLRPALPDHAPRTAVEPGLLTVNGLFRHGWLIAPALLADALDRCALAHALHAPPQTAPTPTPATDAAPTLA